MAQERFRAAGLAGVREGRGPTAVFLHGGLLDSRLFGPQLDALSAGRTCLALDLPGFGASPALPEMTLDSLADMVAAGLPTIAAEPVDVVGVSLGAGVAVRLATLYPHLVRSLALVSFNPRGGVRGRGADLHARLAEYGPAVVAKGFAAGMVGPDDDASVRALIETMALATSRSTMTALFSLIGDYPMLSETLPALARPILFLSGDNDTAFDRERLSALAAGLDEARLVVVRRAGHLPVLSRPDATNEALLAFWDGVDAARPARTEAVT